MPRLKFVSKVEGADTIELQESIITIGRGVNNVICIEDANISKNHVLLIMEESAYRIFDLHSINGTTVNGKRIGTATLQDGDAVRIGYLDLIYEVVAPAPAKLVAPEPPAAPVIAAPAPPPPAPATPVSPTPAKPEPVTPVIAAPAPPPPVAPVVAKQPPTTPVEPIAPVPTKRSFFSFFGKRAAAPTPAPAPAAPAVPEPVVPTVVAPTPPTTVTPEPPAATVKNAPATTPPSQKKFGAPPGGQKIRLKRE